MVAVGPTVPVCALLSVICVLESMLATTAPDATLVPDADMPTATPALDDMLVSVNCPLVPLAVGVTVALKQCAAWKYSAFALVGKAVVMPAIYLTLDTGVCKRRLPRSLDVCRRRAIARCERL